MRHAVRGWAMRATGKRTGRRLTSARRRARVGPATVQRALDLCVRAESYWAYGAWQSERMASTTAGQPAELRWRARERAELALARGWAAGVDRWNRRARERRQEQRSKGGHDGAEASE